MRIAYWTPKTTHAQYVILIAVPLQQKFTEVSQCYVITALSVLFSFHTGVHIERPNYEMRAAINMCTL